jgi:glycosyltransferase involved in cell wall biosynthesis
MLLAASILVLLVLALSWGRQAWWSLRLAVRYPVRPASPDDPGAEMPRAVVLLPLRGADPVLPECLRGLLRQEYPRYEIHIILDSEEDPAWQAVREALADKPTVPVKTTVLTRRPETCSLKVAALLQGLDGLDGSVEVVAQVDADVVPPPHWLRELVRPFADPAVGAVSGLRWYHTDDTSWGSLVRGLWGAGATAQMYTLGIPWGGSLSFRAAVARDPVLRRIWERSFVEDTSAADFLGARGLKLRMVPRLTMINPEAIGLGACYRFLRRQMLCVRLHHPRWREVFWTTAGMSLSFPLAIGCAAWAFAVDATPLAWSLLGALAGGVLAAGLPLAWIDGCFYYAAPADAPLAPLRWKHIPVIFVTLFLHQVALLAACRSHEIDWRGVRYSVGPGGVRRLTDGPYAEPTARAESIV